MILDNRKLLSAVRSESDPSASENPLNQWKMFVSPFLDSQDIKNQNIVLKAFKSLQIKSNASPTFKVYPQSYSIKIVLNDGSKYFFPFWKNLIFNYRFWISHRSIAAIICSAHHIINLGTIRNVHPKSIAAATIIHICKVQLS